MRATRTVGMLFLLLCCMGSILAQQPFTYQGMLKTSGIPANGNYDFQFSLWTASSGGSQVGSTITRIGVSVSNGLFSTELDFGSVWDGNERYLQIAVRPSESGAYTTLSPRVKVNRVPYSQLAFGALSVPWSGIVGMPAGFADGVDNDTTYTAGAGLQLVGNTFSIASGGVVSAMLADGSVTTTKIADGAVTTAKIGDGQVTDAKIASVSWSKVTGAPSSFPPGGDAGGDLSGSYPNPTVAKLQGRAVANTAPSAGQVLKWDGSAWSPSVDLSGSDLWQASGSDIFYSVGNVGIGTTAPGHALHVETSTGDRAIFGYHTATTGFSYGGWFESRSSDGTGVFGKATATSGTTYGVYGQNASPYGRGVYGWAYATSGANYGVYGRSDSTSGYGVAGVASATSGTTYGVYGRSESTSGYGGYFVGRGFFSDDVGIGGNPESRLHVIAGSAGTMTADANSVLTIEHNDRAYLSILTPDAKERGILFGQPSNNVAGGIIYNSTATLNGFQFRTNGNTTRMVIDGSGNVGIGLTAPTARLHIRNGDLRVDSGQIQSWGAITLHPDVDNSGDDIVAFVDSAGTEVMRVHSNGNVGIGTSNPLYPLHVETNAGDRAIYGKNTAASGATYGGYFEGGSRGVFGYAPFIGVHGKATSTTSNSYGGYFESTGPAGYGVYGLASAANASNYGGYFQSVSSSGTGVLGRSPYRGVRGEAYDTGGVNSGVEGESSSTSGRGVYGAATASTGTTYGVYGLANSTNGGTGVYGEAPYTGVKGLATSTSGSTYGAYGSAYSPSGYGVYGTSPAHGVYGQATSTIAYPGVGVEGRSDNANGFGIRGSKPAGGLGYGVYFENGLAGTGTKSFQMDHPLSPETHYLNHFCTEGPEPYNAYSGNVVTDARGYAVVHLPDYFESINRDFRYQLTVIDGAGEEFVQARVVRKIQNNQFVIRTSKPFVEVSWRVEAIRNDRWVQEYGYQAEQVKPAEYRGRYLNPELYGQPKEMGIHYLPEPERPSETEKPK